jgi:hypothetical protein
VTHYISQIYIFKSVSNRSQSPRCVQQISETPHRPWTPNLILGYIRELGAFSRIVIPQRTFMSPPRFWVSIDTIEGGARVHTTEELKDSTVSDSLQRSEASMSSAVRAEAAPCGSAPPRTTGGLLLRTSIWRELTKEWVTPWRRHSLMAQIHSSTHKNGKNNHTTKWHTRSHYVKNKNRR